ncbi:MAG: hypothetical protein KC635_10140 [Myxococcales bacterium]|nr:hypothetical protein [Myxococcales bacterium]
MTSRARLRPALAALPLAALLVAAALSAAARAGVDVDVRATLEWLTAGRWLAARDTAANPDNAVLRLETLSLDTELRPRLKLELGDLTAVARPRFIAAFGLTRAGGDWGELARDADVAVSEAFLSYRFSDAIALTYGLQVFDWGPGELLSPSNRLFHEVAFLKDPLWLVPGHHLLRLNASAGKSITAVLLVELGAGDHPEAFRYGEAHDDKALLKLEYMAEDGGAWIGATVGAGVHTDPFWGLYAAAWLGDSVMLYLDAAETAGSDAWYPAADAPAFTQRERASERVRTLALVGARYAFEQGADLRLEALLDDAGWTEAEMRRGAATVAAAPTADRVGPWLLPGLELLGRAYLHLALRVPQLPPGDDLTLQVRALASLTDGSLAGFLGLSWEVSDATALFASALVTSGRDDAELARLARGSLTLGVTHAW